MRGEEAPIRPVGVVEGMKGLDTAILVERCRKGDALAWEALVRQFQSRIYGLAFYYLKDAEEARDLAQEIFVRLYQNLDNFKQTQNFVPWMLSIARNCSIDRLRRLKVRPRTSWTEETPEPEDHGPNPEQAYETQNRKRLVYNALEKLSLQSREMILLKEIQGLKIREIAQVLALPQGTVKSRFGRARLELARAVMELEPAYGRSE